MIIPEIHQWYVALHHRTSRGDNARKVEPVGVWLRSNANCLLREIADDWIAVGLAPTNGEASAFLDRFQEEMSR